MSPWGPLPSSQPERDARGGGDELDPRPVRDSLPALAERLGAPAPSVLTTIFGRWEELVGPSIAANSWPVSLTRGVLVVGVDHPGWATELRFLAADLVGQVTAMTGADVIQRVDIKVFANRPFTRSSATG